MEDFREDGYNAGRGQAWRNDHHEPQIERNKMKIWTQKDVDAVAPDEDGIRHYPANSSFAEGCSFAEECNFARGCNFEGTKKQIVGTTPFLAIDRAGSAQRKTYFWMFKSGIWVRAGCFFGPLEEFRKAVDAEHGTTHAYHDFADLAEKEWKRAKTAKKERTGPPLKENEHD